MSDTTRSELEEQRQFLLQSLRDLEREREAGEIDDDDYQSLHDDYTARTATVLRQIDELEAPSVAGRGRIRRRTGPAKDRVSRADRAARVRVSRSDRAARARVSRSDRAARARAAGKKRKQISPGVYIGAVVVAAIVGAGFSVVAFSTGRAPEPDPRAGLNRQLERAHQLETQNKGSEALRAYDEVLQQDPNNVEALAYRGWLLGRAGNDAPDATAREELLTKATESLDRAVAINPNYADARFFRGMILFRFRNQPGPAIPEFEAYLAAKPAPNQAAAVQRVLDEARRAAAGSAPPPGG